MQKLLQFFIFFSSIAAVAIAEEAVPNQPFQQFTGKISGNKVRLRIKPDLESQIVGQFNKNDLVLVVGEKGAFWELESPKEIKSYIFRSYLIDNVVEANSVNVRIAPNMDSQVIGKVQKGDKVEGTICPSNPKWIEITTPKHIHFYIAKDFVENAGQAEMFSEMVTKKEKAETNLKVALNAMQTECVKPFEDMKIDPIVSDLETIIKEYSDLPEYTKQATDALALLQDNYLKKKITYLESQNSLSKNECLGPKESEKTLSTKEEKVPSDKVDSWQSLEDKLYATWSTFHPEKTRKDFYEEQKLISVSITGQLESFKQVKNRPGDYILRDENNVPVAYLYSTNVDLEPLIGKNVKILASPRPNNNFAFPAYFVNAVE